MVAVTPHVRVLPTREDNAFSMEPALLEAAIKEDLAAGEDLIQAHLAGQNSMEAVVVLNANSKYLTLRAHADAMKLSLVGSVLLVRRGG